MFIEVSYGVFRENRCLPFHPFPTPPHSDLGLHCLPVLFAFQKTKPLLKKGLLKNGSIFIPKGANSFVRKETKTIFDGVDSPESVMLSECISL